MKQMLLRLICGTLLLALAVASQGCTDRDAAGAGSGEANLISDVQTLRKSDRRSEIDITETAEKYFPIGTSKAAADSEFKRLGFTAHSTSSTSAGDRWMYSKDLRRSVLGFHDEIRVILTYTDRRVSGVWARVFFHSL